MHPQSILGIFRALVNAGCMMSDHPELAIMPALNWVTVTVQNRMRIRVGEMTNNFLDKLSKRIRTKRKWILYD